jgi:hypothetical protein
VALPTPRRAPAPHQCSTSGARAERSAHRERTAPSADDDELTTAGAPPAPPRPPAALQRRGCLTGVAAAQADRPGQLSVAAEARRRDAEAARTALDKLRQQRERETAEREAKQRALEDERSAADTEKRAGRVRTPRTPG